MGRLKTHVRNKFVAGILAAIPVAVTFFILWYVDSRARLILGIDVPFLGIVVALAAIYLLGLFVTSVIGRFLIGATDWILGHVPGLRDLYRAGSRWRSPTPTTAASASSARSCWSPTTPGGGWSSASSPATRWRAIPGPAACSSPPRPTRPAAGCTSSPSSRLVRVDLARQEAIKMIISGGNYVPARAGRRDGRRPRV